DVDVEERVRIHPLDLRHDARKLDRAVRVELRGKRVMSCGALRCDEGAERQEQRGGFRSHRSTLHFAGRGGRSPRTCPSLAAAPGPGQAGRCAPGLTTARALGSFNTEKQYQFRTSAKRPVSSPCW